jgi:hypothetical protein
MVKCFAPAATRANWPPVMPPPAAAQPLPAAGRLCRAGGSRAWGRPAAALPPGLRAVASLRHWQVQTRNGLADGGAPHSSRAGYRAKVTVGGSGPTARLAL